MNRLTDEQIGVLLEEWKPEALGLLRKFTIPHYDAEEVLQEAALKFWKTYASSNVRAPRALFYAVLRNLACNWIRENIKRTKTRHLDVDLVVSENPPGYRLDGPLAARQTILRMVAFFPGADAQAVKLLLDHGSAERAALALLERGGLEDPKKAARDKAHRIRSYLHRFAARVKRITDETDLVLLALFNYRNWDLIVERVTRNKPYRYNNDADKQALVDSLDRAPFDLAGLQSVAHRDFNKALTLTMLSRLSAQAAGPRQPVGSNPDHVMKAFAFARYAREVSLSLNDVGLQSKAVDAMYLCTDPYSLRSVQRALSMVVTARRIINTPNFLENVIAEAKESRFDPQVLDAATRRYMPDIGDTSQDRSELILPTFDKSHYASMLAARANQSGFPAFVFDGLDEVFSKTHLSISMFEEHLREVIRYLGNASKHDGLSTIDFGLLCADFHIAADRIQQAKVVLGQIRSALESALGHPLRLGDVDCPLFSRLATGTEDGSSPLT